MENFVERLPLPSVHRHHRGDCTVYQGRLKQPAPSPLLVKKVDFRPKQGCTTGSCSREEGSGGTEAGSEDPTGGEGGEATSGEFQRAESN
jgi:hypothetical protein